MHKETVVFKRNIHVKSGHIELTTKFQLYALRCFLTSLYVAPCITYSAVGFLTFANKPPQLWYLIIFIQWMITHCHLGPENY